MSKQKLTRREFLKGAVATAAASAVFGVTGGVALAEEKGIYTPGTYSAKAQGIGEVVMSVTFDANSITAIDLDVSGETENIGQAAKDELVSQLMAAQGSEIDGVAGATVTTSAVKSCLDSCIAQAKGEAVDVPVEAAASEIRYDANGVCLMEDWLGEAPKFDTIDEEVEADIIVCGGGLSGVSAARQAAEDGATVILFEKCDSLQCRSGDFGVIGSKLVTEKWGRDMLAEKDAIVESLVHESGNRAHYRLWQMWADEVGDAFDWYANTVEDLYCLGETTEMPPEGVEQWLQPARYPSPEAFNIDEERYKTYQCTVQFYPDQSFVFQKHWAKAEETGNAKAYLATPVKKLLQDETGRVTGVIAQDYDGKVYKATAKKAVILATGDYSSNEDMLHYYNPQTMTIPHFFTSVDPEGKMANTGDGHRMGMWIGAKMEEWPHATNDHNMGGVLGSTGFLELNIYGERFQNEDCPGQELNNLMNRLPGRTIYQIFDANWVNEVPLMTPGHGQVCALVSEEAAAKNGSLTAIYGYANQKMVDDSVAAGQTLMGETIEELVDQFDITDEAKQTAIASIKRYSELAEKGVDEDFGKMGKRLSKLQTPPYYACKIGMGAMLCVHGGLECDMKLRVLDKDRKVIPGLYVTGNTMGGRYGSTYPITVPGSSHSSALTFGRIAGRNAAAEEV